MTQIVDLGKLRFYWAGNYDPATEYELNDVVRYGGNVYVYINVVKTIGNEPTDPAYWAMMVEGINFIGEWNAATQYYIGDAVAYGSTVYVSLADNINKRPDLFPLIWSQFVEAIQYEGVYNPATTYQPNDVVSYGPSAYIAKQTTNNNLPTNTTYWDPFVQGISPEGVYNNATAYVPGQIVAYGANLYVCTANTVGNIPTNTSYWELFVDTIRTRGDWATATQYYINDIVTYGGNTYICLIQNVSGTFATDLAANKWEVFNGGVRWRGAWAPSTPYLVNDIVRNVGSSYIATEDFTSGPNFSVEFDAGKWVFFAQGGDDVLPVITPGVEGYSLTVNADGATIDWINATGSTNVFYVSPDGDNSNPGTSLALPFANIKNAVAAVPPGQSATIFVKTGTYSEVQLPIIVPPTVAIVGDNQRTVIVQPGPGLAADGITPNNQATMFYMSNASILNKMTFVGMTGWVPGSTPANITTSTPKGVVAALNPASTVTTKSPYILECSAIGSGCIGALVDGSTQASGYKSMLFHGYTVISDNGVGFWVKDGGRAEIVSCFTYYAYFGYAASGGGVIRSLNGNNSYGTWGASSFGFLASETPHVGALYGKQLTVTADPITQGFAAGTTITGLTSGATGTVTNLQASAAKIYYNQTSVTNFQNGEDITDGTYTLTLTGSGVSNQNGYLLVANGFNDAPLPGASIQIAGDPSAYVVQSVSGTYVDATSVLSIALAQEKLTTSPPGAVLTIRYNYSQIRLTGHDFLSIGTGGIATTNYPNQPLQPPAQGNEVDEDLPGRVYYVSTDQDGNFRVGEYFRVDQATGTATLNANAFNLAGLTSLRLGSIGAQLGETINEFSSDVTLGGANPTNVAVPTEAAVKTYVDNRVPQAIPTSVGQDNKVLTSAGAAVAWQALNLNDIVGPNTIFAQTGTAITYGYALFSNTLLPPATWSLTGTVPTGVSINSSTGVLTVGSTAVAGSSSFNVKATGASNTGTLTEAVSLTVNGAYPLFSATVLPSAVTPSAAFSSTATQATALTGTVVHTVTAGALPAWLTLSSGGVLSGTAPASPTNTYLGPFSFTVTATNGVYSNSRSFDWSPYLGLIQGQNQYTTPGTYTWVAPTAVTSVSVVAVGGGGAGLDGWANPAGSGAGLGWKNNITVVPGQSYTVVVGAGGISYAGNNSNLLGGNSYFISLGTVAGYGGGNASQGGTGGPNQNTYGGGYVGDGGGAGGTTGVDGPNYYGGAGAGGYTGRGGNNYSGYTPSPSNSGGGGGGGYYSSTYGSGAGGGVGLQGRGPTGSGGNYMYNPFQGYNNSYTYGSGGAGGSGGSNGFYGENPFSGQGQSSSNIQGGSYGGGGGGPGSSWPSASGEGGGGGVRIIWGTGRAFPDTNTADVTPSGPA